MLTPEPVTSINPRHLLVKEGFKNLLHHYWAASEATAI